MRNFIVVLLLLIIVFPLVAQDQEEKKQRYVGSFTIDEVLSHDERYENGAFIYIPDDAALEVFSSISEPVLIKMFYRTDCPDSWRECPRFIKTIQVAANDNITVECIGVNRAKNAPADLVAGWNVERVPTFIVIYNEKEVGRVVETAKESIEIDLAAILKAIGD